MCGFAGWIDFQKDLTNEVSIIEAMTDTLKLRGPDQHGYHTTTHVLLGHRRLIVVDPNGGLQPMTKMQGNFHYTLVYNGELYNTEDIRKELLEKGYTFDSYSDTEVLLTAYMCWGIDCVSKLNGIFAFAVYDEKEQRILLVRDPLGVKPLFYSIKGSSFIFGSEIKTVLAHPYVEPILDKEGLTEIFALGPAVKPGSAVFKEIKEVPPAHLAIITPDQISIKEYWTLKPEENHETLEEATDHLRSLLIDAIERQLVGDMPLCTFLSGGLDSSAISAVAANAYKKQNKVLTTYSLEYEDNSKFFKPTSFEPTSDPYWAHEMAEFIHSNQRIFTIKHEDLAMALKDAVIARDLPGMADIDSSLFLFCKEIRKDFVIALSGECADEIFGGYPWYTRPELMNLNTFPWSNFVRSRRKLLSDEFKTLPITDMVNENYLDSLKRVPHLPNEPANVHRMRELFYLNIKWFMVNLLNRKDRMSMSNSLEVRVPFADYRLVEYAFNLPIDYMFYEGREKGLLRKCLQGILPDDIIYRKKSPYPKTHNPVYTDFVCQMLAEVLKNPNAPLFDIIDHTFATELLNTKGAAYTRPWFGQLMTGPQLMAYLVQLNIWLETYKVKLV
nr:asparagine synthase (glutamine-hydrolyzing) [uncultured Cellulosilyticum sp.]